MDNKEMYDLIGNRAKELTKDKKVQAQMIQIFNEQGKEAAETFVYKLAIATLIGG